MPAKYTGNTRVKKFNLDRKVVESAQVAADRDHEGSASALGRSIIRDFLEKGSDFAAPELVRFQVTIEPETVQLAEAKARAEYGVGIKDILRHELAKRGAKARRARR